MSDLTLEAKIGQMCMVGFEGLEPPGYLLDWLAQGRVGGVILFARNIDTPEQVARMTDAIQATAGGNAIISIDQEGGTVARLREGFSEGPGAFTLASIPDDDVALAHTERTYGVLGAELRALGIGWDYAPVVDLDYTPANPSVGTRALGSDPARVGRLAAAAVRGLQGGSQGGAGVAACAKHFPGLGDTPIDTHVALPVLETPLESLLAHDLLPYHAVIAAGIASIMATHTIYRALDADYPATLSPAGIDLIRRARAEDGLGFEGVVTTDCMEMRAIADHYGSGESAVLAALAGIDLILFSHTRAAQAAAYDALLAAAQSGRLPLAVVDAANRRIAALKRAYVLPRGDLSDIRSATHLAAMQEAARAGLVLLRSHDGVLPLHGRVGVVEFASVLESGIVEQGGQTGLTRLLRQRLPNAHVVALMTGAPTDPAEAMLGQIDTLVLVTRNAHLNPAQAEAARRLTELLSDVNPDRRVVLVAARHPQDAHHFPQADVIVATGGDSAPSLEAAVAALMGDFTAGGKLAVDVQWA